MHSALVRFGIERREAKNTASCVKHLMYGKKMENGKAVDSMSEMRVVKAILGFHDDGMSLRQTCRFLESTGVPTKTKKSRCHPTMVNRIINHYGNTKSKSNHRASSSTKESKVLVG